MADRVSNIEQLSLLLSRACNEGELAVLLEGLLTPQEAEEVVLRWQLLVRLLEGETQRDIARDLGVSLGKIARGSRLLQFGPTEFRELAERLRTPTRP